MPWARSRSTLPLQALRVDGDRLVLPGVTEDGLEEMPDYNEDQYEIVGPDERLRDHIR